MKILKVFRPSVMMMTIITSAAAGGMVRAELPAGKWKLQAQIAVDHNVQLSLDIDGTDNSPSMLLHLLETEAQMLGLPAETRNLALTDVVFNGSRLSWTVPFPDQPAQCSVGMDEGSAGIAGSCQRGSQNIPIRLIPAAETRQVEIEESSSQQRVFLEAVHRAVGAVDKKDFEAFERLFTPRVKGMEPDQLWKGASVVLLKFGQVKKIGFSEMDGDGAFVRVTFERAERELFVRLDEQGLIRELTYVPPLNVHNQ